VSGTEVSLERVAKVLMCLGISRRDAEIYMHLAAKGPQKAKSIAEALGISKRNVYRNLTCLQRFGLVCSSIDRAAEYSAVSFERAIDLHQQRNRKQADFLQTQKARILSKWRSLKTDDSQF